MKFSRISFLSLPNGLRRFSAALRLRKSALSPCPLARCFFMLLFLFLLPSVASCLSFFFLWPIRSFLFLLFFYIPLVIAFFFFVFLSYIVLLFFSFSVRFFDRLSSLFIVSPTSFIYFFIFLSNSNTYLPHRCRLHELPAKRLQSFCFFVVISVKFNSRGLNC